MKFLIKNSQGTWEEYEQTSTGYFNFRNSGTGTLWRRSRCTTKQEVLDYCAMWGGVLQSSYDPNDLFPCCKGQSGTGPYLHSGGKWHEATCTELLHEMYGVSNNAIVQPVFNLPDFVERPKNLGRCTCGSAAVGSDKHSYYCDIK